MNKISKIDFLKLGEKMIAVIALLMPFSAFADLPQPGCGTLNGLSCTTGGVNDLIIRVINILLGVAFLVAVLFLILGGFRYIVSGGNEKTAEAGKKTVLNALIGIVIVILSYVIVQVVSRTVSSGASGNPA